MRPKDIGVIKKVRKRVGHRERGQRERDEDGMTLENLGGQRDRDIGTVREGDRERV